jgi:cellulose synthase/poly-beta-1,6-N-acetylglucosamine synthase-like glycosyltransferase
MTITVGICAYNEDKNIGSLLSNVLYEQNLPTDSEILVVCSGCTDNTVGIVKEYAKKDARVKMYVEAERRGKASAVNRILANANGDAIAFISADTMPQRGCFARLLTRLQTSKVGLVCGKPSPINGSKSLAGRMVRILWSLHDHLFKQVSEAGTARHASEVFCVRKEVADKIPIETVNDDAYIALTAKKKGWLVGYEPESCVSIRGPETITDYIKQRRRVIYGHHQLKRLTGKSPQYFAPLIQLDGKSRIKMLKSLVCKNDPLSILAFVLIELVLNGVVKLDIITGKSYSIWNIAASTKKGILYHKTGKTSFD